MRRTPHALRLSLLLSLIWTPAGAAPTADAAPHQVIVCRSPSAVREIRTYYAAAAACRVDYLKNGEVRTLWSATSDRQYCASRAAALAATLKRGNFACETSGSTAVVADDANKQAAVPSGDADDAGLTQSQIASANQWLQQRVEAAARGETLRTGPEAKRFSAQPDFLSAADVDADGRTDLVLGWGWASFRCDGTFLTVLLNDGDGARPAYRAAEAELPGNCGAKGWLSSVADVKGKRIFIRLQQRYPGSNNLQQIIATVSHAGHFTFFGPNGIAATLPTIEQSLPTRTDSSR